MIKNMLTKKLNLTLNCGLKGITSLILIGSLSSNTPVNAVKGYKDSSAKSTKFDFIRSKARNQRHKGSKFLHKHKNNNQNTNQTNNSGYLYEIVPNLRGPIDNLTNDLWECLCNENITPLEDIEKVTDANTIKFRKNGKEVTICKDRLKDHVISSRRVFVSSKKYNAVRNEGGHLLDKITNLRGILQQSKEIEKVKEKIGTGTLTNLEICYKANNNVEHKITQFPNNYSLINVSNKIIEDVCRFLNDSLVKTNDDTWIGKNDIWITDDHGSIDIFTPADTTPFYIHTILKAESDRDFSFSTIYPVGDNSR